MLTANALKMLTTTKMNTIKIVLFLLVVLGGFLAQPVQAQDLCATFPTLCGVTGKPTPGEDDAQNFLVNRISIVVSMIFIGILVVGVFIIIRAGYKYISSQGNDQAIAQSQDSIKNVFIGIAMLFVGILGIVLVLSFFGGEWLLGGLGLTIDDVLQPDF
jgi:hypothetical protein